MDKIRGFIRGLKRGIRNVIYWLPVIWKDCHWDYSFFLDIMRHKLEAMRLSATNWMSEGNEKIVDDIQEAIVLIDRIANEEYEQHAFDIHERRWGKSKMVFEPINDKFSEVDFIYPKALDQDEAKEQLTILLRGARGKRQEAIDTLFGIIKDNFETWWD